MSLFKSFYPSAQPLKEAMTQNSYIQLTFRGTALRKGSNLDWLKVEEEISQKKKAHEKAESVGICDERMFFN